MASFSKYIQGLRVPELVAGVGLSLLSVPFFDRAEAKMAMADRIERERTEWAFQARNIRSEAALPVGLGRTARLTGVFCLFLIVCGAKGRAEKGAQSIRCSS